MGGRTPGLGPLLALVLVVFVGLVGVRVWQAGSQRPAAEASPSADAVAQTPSGSLRETSTLAPSAPPSATPVADDSATARAIATEYETARASGNWERAWSMLSAASQRLFGSLAKYEELERAYNAAGGTTFEVGDPTQDPELLRPEFLGRETYLDVQSKADLKRAWLVFVNHPKVKGASAASTGLLVAPIGDHWYVWIVH